MSKTLTTRKKNLNKKVDAAQIEAAEKRFEIKFDDRKMVKTLMDHLNKGYGWKTSNAAAIVTLYDQLKKQNKELLTSDSTDTIISLRGHELNALYQALLNVEGTGIEAARKFIIMLTHVGETVSKAMTKLADMNTKIQEMHKELAEIETQIQTAPEVEVETAETHETSK
jgi:transketolase N-terminal domain/subunit|tara:strand:+ start:647 stop:1153 length:507 start_codon:yes stop_codon:yes gene_type:complete